MQTSNVPTLRALPLFAKMSERHFNTLIGSACVQCVGTHINLVVEGDRAEFLHVLLEGKVEPPQQQRTIN